MMTLKIMEALWQMAKALRMPKEQTTMNIGRHVSRKANRIITTSTMPKKESL